MNIQETMDSLQTLRDMNRVLVMHVEGSEVLSYLIWGKMNDLLINWKQRDWTKRYKLLPLWVST